MEGKLFLGQYLIWVILLFGQLHGCKSCIEKERKALVELKKHIVDSDLDYVLPTWNNDTKSECCRWEGIMCNRTSGRVIGISFGGLGYTYSKETSPLNLSLLHPFEEVQSLDLSGRQFNGFVDDVEGYKSLRRLRNLETLDLSINKFNDSILPFLNAATSLTALDLSSNAFSSIMELQVVCRMKNLRELDLSGNRFVGQLPFCLGSLKKLRVLDFSSNQLSGNLPSSFNSLESLEYLMESGSYKERTRPVINRRRHKETRILR